MKSRQTDEQVVKTIARCENCHRGFFVRCCPHCYRPLGKIKGTNVSIPVVRYGGGVENA